MVLFLASSLACFLNFSKFSLLLTAPICLASLISSTAPMLKITGAVVGGLLIIAAKSAGSINCSFVHGYGFSTEDNGTAEVWAFAALTDRKIVTTMAGNMFGKFFTLWLAVICYQRSVTKLGFFY